MTSTPKPAVQTSKLDTFIGKYLWIVNLLVVAGFLFSKGWIAVFMLYFWPVLILIFILQIVWFRSAYKLVQSGAAPQYLLYVILVMSVALDIAYICLPGFGDTNEVGAFGYMATTSRTALYSANMVVYYTSLCIGAISFIYALALYILAAAGQLSRKK